MSDDGALPAVAFEQDPALPGWNAAAPVDLRWLAAVALAVPLLLAAGVYWLHRLPLGTNLRIDDSVIEVRLIGPQGGVVQRQDSVQPATKPPQPPVETLMEAPRRAIPEAVAASVPPEPARTAPARVASVPEQVQVDTHADTHPSMDRRAVTFQRALLSHIARYRRYPEGARRDQARGTVQLVFSMLRDGTVTDVRIASSSGYSLLDIAAIETIRKAQPLPRIPAELPERLNILVPVAFELPP
jgi:periplasmic protein TonB